MRSFPASGVTGLHTIGAVRGPAAGGPLPEAGRLNRYFSPVCARCTGRSGQEAARVASGGGSAGEMAVAGYGQDPGPCARSAARSSPCGPGAPPPARSPRPGRRPRGQPRTGSVHGRRRCGQVTVRGDELGRGDAAPASVPMLTEPASAQQDAVEFPGIPIPPTVTYPQRHPARKTPGQIRSHRSGRPSLRLSGRCGPRARAGPGRGPG